MISINFKMENFPIIDTYQSTTCEFVCLKQLLKELQFGYVTQITLIYDNQVIQINFNLVFHERTKHIEVDCHFIQEKIISGDIKTEFVN